MKINDYSEDYFNYLQSGEDIATHQIEATTGLTVLTNTRTDNQINYRIRGNNPSDDNGFEQIRITVTTSTGRVDIRLISFEVLPITIEPERFRSVP